MAHRFFNVSPGFVGQGRLADTRPCVKQIRNLLIPKPINPKPSIKNSLKPKINPNPVVMCALESQLCGP